MTITRRRRSTRSRPTIIPKRRTGAARLLTITRRSEPNAEPAVARKGPLAPAFTWRWAAARRQGEGLFAADDIPRARVARLTLPQLLKLWDFVQRRGKRIVAALGAADFVGFEDGERTEQTSFFDQKKGRAAMVNTIKAVLLDIDGTLVDSNDAHAAAWVDALAEAGFDVTFDRVRALIGKGGDKVLPELTGLEDDSPRGEEITARRAAIFRKTYYPTLRPFPGGRALLARFKSLGLTLVVATSAGEKELAPLLKVAQIDDLVDARTSSSDAEKSKPDPDILQVALARAGCKPHEAIMLGDTPYDLESARRAGITAVAVRSGGWGDEDLSAAAAIYDDVGDILRHIESSPFARSR